MTIVSFMTANFVARELGFDMPNWEAGDRATRAAFRPIETYRQRFGALLDEVGELGFDAIDLWDAHLSASWATDDHIGITVDLLAERGMRVASLAGWFGADIDSVETACRIAVAVGAPVLGGGSQVLETDREALVELLERHDLWFGIENHPERSPAEMLTKIGDGAHGRIGTTVDTGWYGTQGYDAARAIEELAPHVLHVHLKDVRQVGIPHETCGYGDGVVPLDACMEALRRIGYDGAISVEHEPDHYDPRGEIRDARELVRSWLAM